jgi:ADP-ribose pyrophosphatase
MSRKRKIEIIEKLSVFEGYFRVNAYRLRHELHAGGMSAEIRREVFERGHAVGVLLYDPARRQVVLLEQFRIGAHVAGFDPWLTEIVAGIIEPGESAEAVARRESFEEAGLTVTDLMAIRHYLVSPGGTSESVQLFLGCVDAGAADGIYGLDHEDEDIRVMVMDVSDAFALLDSDKANNALLVIALQWLALNENRVRTAWGFGPV